MRCCGIRPSRKTKSFITEPTTIRTFVTGNFGVARLQVEVQYSETSKVIIGENNELNSAHTTSYLLSKALELYPNESSKQDQSKMMKMIGLQTKSGDLHLDYLLSLPDYPLDFLPQNTILVPYYSTPLLSPTMGVSLGDFQIKAKLGEGGFSKVFLVRLRSNGCFYALKQMNKSTVSEDERQRMIRERDIMSEIESPLCLKLFYAFQTANYCYLVLEFLPGGDLQQFIVKTKTPSEQQAKLLAAEVLMSIEELHSNKIIYRDLKIENVLVDNEGHLKLADFGFARKLTDSKKFAGTLCGTLSSASPELLKSEKYDFRTDYYSMGVLIYELATYQPLFAAKELEDLLFKIAFTQPEFPKTMSKELKNLITKLICKEPEKRLGSKKGIQEIIQHPWFKGIDFQAIRERKNTPPIQQPSLITKELPLLDPTFQIEEDLGGILTQRLSFGKKLSLFTYTALEPTAAEMKNGGTTLEFNSRTSKTMKCKPTTLEEVSDDNSGEINKSTLNDNDINYNEEIDEIDTDHGDLTQNLSRCNMFSTIMRPKSNEFGPVISNSFNLYPRDFQDL